jgi:hypothetical protein
VIEEERGTGGSYTHQRQLGLLSHHQRGVSRFGEARQIPQEFPSLLILSTTPVFDTPSLQHHSRFAICFWVHKRHNSMRGYFRLWEKRKKWDVVSKSEGRRLKVIYTALKWVLARRDTAANSPRCLTPSFLNIAMGCTYFLISLLEGLGPGFTKAMVQVCVHSPQSCQNPMTYRVMCFQVEELSSYGWIMSAFR